jgi:hypothetical protein
MGGGSLAQKTKQKSEFAPYENLTSHALYDDFL